MEGAAKPVRFLSVKLEHAYIDCLDHLVNFIDGRIHKYTDNAGKYRNLPCDNRSYFVVDEARRRGIENQTQGICAHCCYLVRIIDTGYPADF